MCCKCCLDNSLRVEHRAVPRFSLTRVKSEAQVPVSLRVVSEARRGGAHARARCVRALSIQRLEGSRSAADAGPMQIEWSGGVAYGCAGVVRRSATADPVGRKVGNDERRL